MYNCLLSLKFCANFPKSAQSSLIINNFTVLHSSFFGAYPFCHQLIWQNIHIGPVGGSKLSKLTRPKSSAD